MNANAQRIHDQALTAANHSAHQAALNLVKTMQDFSDLRTDDVLSAVHALMTAAKNLAGA